MFSANLCREDFINQYPLLNLMNVKEVEQMNSKRPVHLYVHIPYCIKKCEFCYYKSFELHDRKIPEDYFRAILKEIEQLSKNPIILSSMYWGGGTPTMMSEEQTELLAETIRKNFETTEDFEFCCEVRPGPETTREKIKVLKNYGLKRVSIGLQSMNSETLKLNGRNHSVNNFLRTYEMLQEERIFSKNVDLMSGMVGDSVQDFLSSLQKLAKLSPENITIYKLQLYYNSRLYQKARADQLPLATNEEEAVMVREGYEYLLGCGYELADNFSFRRSREYEHLHRTRTWLGEDMIGAGLSSHSCVGRRIYQNENSINRYIERVDSGESPIQRAYTFSVYEDMLRHFIFGIKSIQYELELFKKRFGMDARKIFENEITWMEDNDYINLEEGVIHTTLTGALYADDIVRAVFPNNQENIIMGHQARQVENKI